jgi:type III secretory pathway component EscU
MEYDFLKDLKKTKSNISLFELMKLKFKKILLKIDVGFVFHLGEQKRSLNYLVRLERKNTNLLVD